MPYLPKMTTHFRGSAYPAAKEPHAKSIYAYDEDYPSKHEHLLYRNKDKLLDLGHRKYDAENDRRTNGTNRSADLDADYAYRKSREKFAAWDIKDLEEDAPSKKPPKSERRSPRDLEVEEILANGRNGSSQRRSASASRQRSSSESPEWRNGRRAKPWSEEDETEEEGRRSQLRGSNGRDAALKKKNERNSGLNLGFRALVDKFRAKPEPEKERRSPEDCAPKDTKTERNHRIREHRRRSPSEEPRPQRASRQQHESKRRSYAFEVAPEELDVRIEKYERAPREHHHAGSEVHRRGSFQERQRAPSRERRPAEVSRKSSLREAPRRQESARRSKPPRPRVSERHSRPLTPPVDQQVEILESFIEESEGNDRLDAEPARGPKGFSMKEWYESNRQFAAKYLKEHSKVRELCTSDVSARDEFVFGSPKEDGRALLEIENHKESRHHHARGRSLDGDEEEGTRRRGARRAGQETGRRRRQRRESLEDEDEEEEEEEEFARRSESYGRSFAMPVRKIWNYRDGGVHITDVEEGQPCLQCGETCSGFLPHNWSSPATPSGQSSPLCISAASLNGKLHRRHTTHSLLGGPLAAQPPPGRMSPKGPEAPKTEVRVSCVPAPGAKPQGVRVRIPEPAKAPAGEQARVRCPSLSEKDFYRKSASLDRRDRYPTLSGAEIKRGLASTGADAQRRRHPMLDRKNRFPTISGAELKRGFTIGKCPLEDGLDLSLAPWPGMKWACVRVLHLYCKVFDQFELFELIVRKNCTSCKCPREAHDVCHDEWVSVRARLGLKADETRDPVSFDPRDAGLAWAPPGLPLHKVEEYFSVLPEISVPRLGTAGERHRDRQLATQLPKQDLARAYCRHLDPQHSVSADDFMAARNEIALDIGTVQEVFDKGVECGACHEPIKYGSLAVSASKLGLLYHPTCFRCLQCEELLVDLAYCVHDDTLYCERHYAEQLKPRCAACDELIFSGEYTKAMNKDWHSGHFCCWQCDESLTGQRYVLRDEHPYCIKCYESVFANGCEECHKIIGIDSKDLSYKDKHWHEACFLCNRCRVSLVDKQFGSKADKIYCGNCYDAQFASRCDGCGEIFRAGTKKMEYKTRQWHEKCFCCVVCKNPIGTKSFIPREQEIYCAGCYEDKFATRCVKCNKIITSGGVTYKNEPWHRDCFTCSHCNQSLAGQRFTSRDEKPYCADCFGELFAKRCTACTKPITGIGGTRFISFEDRHWHNDCFICAGCKSSLVGRGFITDGEDIICPECAKQKLS